MYAVETLNPEPRLGLEAQSANWRIKGQGRWNLKLTLKIQTGLGFTVFQVEAWKALTVFIGIWWMRWADRTILCSAAFDT